MTEKNLPFSNGIAPVTIENEMQRSYLDYAMSVIVSRALPDCRDGLKPVHRRILYAMHDTGNHHNKPYRKSARVVGEVMGKYHPHGDAAIYSTLARMTQPFSLRATLIDGQGNFGSIDGDSPAQMRYTEVRLEKLADVSLLADIDKDTVDFQENYDGSEYEPKVLPARFPNLLVNGTSGIAVGMATNIPTHNIGEVIDACCAYLDDENITIEKLLEYVPGPDFPTGGEIVGYERIRTALSTGRGIITVRGKALIEEGEGNSKAVIITELPYQLNKSELVKNIEELGRNKVIEGITEIRDESNKLGIRVVIEVKKDIEPEVIINQLYRHTQLQSSFGVNMLALKNGQPVVMNLHDLISSFIDFRQEIVTRRILFLLKKARDKAHLLIGLLIAVDNIDDIITLIRQSPDPVIARSLLLEKKWLAKVAAELIKLIDDWRNELDDEEYCYLTDEQAKAILEMRLQRLTNLEHNKIREELNQLAEEIKGHLDVLGSKSKLLDIIRTELLEIKANFGTPRRTQIVHSSLDIADEDLIQQEEMVVTVTRTGYIKRSSLSNYRSQKRGGKGKLSMTMHNDDIITNVIATNTHDSMLFFSNIGKVYRLKVYKLPLGSMQSKGRALVNILPLSPEEKINNIIALSFNEAKRHELDKNDEIDDTNDINKTEKIENLVEESRYIVFATSLGNTRRNALSDFSNIPSSGKIAIRLEGNDKLIGVVICTEREHILLATAQGKAVRFPVSDLRIFKSRTSDGVRGVKLSLLNDSVVSISVLNGIEMEQSKKESFLRIPVDQRMMLRAEAESDFIAAKNLAEQYISDNKLGEFEHVLSPEEIVEFAVKEQFIFTLNNKGYGKRTSAYEYRVISRGGRGIINMDINEGVLVVSSFPAENSDDIIVLTDSGTVIRTKISSVRITGRSALGVRIINLKGVDDAVSSITKLSNPSEENEDIEELVEDANFDNSQEEN